MNTLENLAEKYLFWKYFFELSSIPRPSRHEEKAREWIIDNAKKWGLEWKEDDFGNISVKVPANNEQMKQLPTVAIQSHVDMVCEKDDIEHDFFNDPLQLFVTDDKQWIKAKGTTLGADNGIAVAYQMAIMDPDCDKQHGPLEMIFTMDEETGLNGAANLDADMLKSSFMINIDNSIEGMCCVGCSGGRDYLADIAILRENAKANTKKFVIEIKGLIGGHSGSEIYQVRASAIKLAERVLSECMEQVELQVYSIEAGDKRNAIPRSAKIEVFASSESKEALVQVAKEIEGAIRSELQEMDKKEFVINILDGATTGDTNQSSSLVLTEASLKNILRIMRICPNGVFARRDDTSSGTMMSTILAVIHTQDTTISFTHNFRFSNLYGGKHIKRVLDSVYADSGAQVSSENQYPAWECVENSPLEQLFHKYYEHHAGRKGFSDITHGGIECGLIQAQVTQSLDVICIGPEIHNLHSPQETMNIASTENIWQVLADMLAHANELQV